MELRRDLSLTSLTLTVVTGTIGSGWLFASYYAARTAGPASLPAWILGGVISFLLALVFAELGSLINTSGALAQIPLLSHGRLSGFIGGWSIWISYLCVPTIELLAMLDYLDSSVPWLTQDRNGTQILSGAGLAVAIVLMVFFTWINLNGVKGLARWINSLTIWKLIVPLLVAGVLMLLSQHWENLSIPITIGSDPSAIKAGSGTELVNAVGSGGILFCLLGFRTAVDLAGEARNPQRNVPLAMGLGLGISLLIYLVLQWSFLVSVPPEALQQGWSQLSLSQHGGPLAAIALGLGLSWMVVLLLIDAALSPSTTAMAYLGVSARVSWMMGRCNLLPASLRSGQSTRSPGSCRGQQFGGGLRPVFDRPRLARGCGFSHGSPDDRSGHGTGKLVSPTPTTPRGERTFSDSLSHCNQRPGFRDGHMGDELVRTHSARGRGPRHRNPKPAVCSLQLEKTPAN